MKKPKFLPYFYGIVPLFFLFTLFAGNHAVTAMVESAPILRYHTIILDAGHGDPDGGATSCTGKLESEFNLEITLRLEDLFHLLGYETRMLRSTESSVYTKGETIAQKKISDLRQRVRIVNQTENGLLLSIHQNNFTDSRYFGAQVFYAPEENSQALARELQSAFVTHLNPGSNRKSKAAKGIYLMEHIQCPGVLIECGFLSNPAEEEKLRSPEYQRQLACVIAATVSTFLSNT